MILEKNRIITTKMSFVYPIMYFNLISQPCRYNRPNSTREMQWNTW